MRAVVPHVKHQLRMLTLESIGRTFGNDDVEYVDVSKDDDGYRNLMERYWRNATDDVLVIEQDIVLPMETARIFHCEHDWCGMTWPTREGFAPLSLSCTKFSKDFIYRTPRVWDRVRELHIDGVPSWVGLSDRLNQALTEEGERPHIHTEGFVINLRYYDAPEKITETSLARR